MADSEDPCPMFRNHNPCIISPLFEQAEKHPARRKFSKENISAKKNLQDWLKLQQLYHSIKNCEVDEEKSELYIGKLNNFIIVHLL